MTKAYNNSLLARNISISGVNTNVSGVLQLNNIDVSVSGHNHIINDVTGLQSALDGKQVSGSYAASSHNHIASQITDFNSSVSGLVSGVYAPLSGAIFTGPVSATSGVFSSGINITSGSGSMYTSGDSIYFLNNSAGNLFFIGDQGGGNNVLSKYQNTTAGPFMFFRKYRGSYSSPSIVASGDNLGSIQFETMNYDGTITTQCARIQASTEAAPASGLTNLASQLKFFTSTSSNTFNTPTQRMVITSNGLVGINKTVPTSTLDVAGLITSNSGNFISSLQVNGTGVSISGHTHSGTDIISGTVADTRLSSNAQASINLYLWANFR